MVRFRAPRQRSSRTAALRQDAGHVGHNARGQPRVRPSRSVADCLRPLHEVPDRLREAIPPGLQTSTSSHWKSNQTKRAGHPPTVPGRQATPGVSSATWIARAAMGYLVGVNCPLLMPAGRETTSGRMVHVFVVNLLGLPRRQWRDCLLASDSPLDV